MGETEMSQQIKTKKRCVLNTIEYSCAKCQLMLLLKIPIVNDNNNKNMQNSRMC